MKAVSLIEEQTTSEEMLLRITEGTDMTVEDQVWVLMQSVNKLLDVLENIAKEHRVGVDVPALTDAVSMLVVAAPGHERETLRKYISGEIPSEELDGPSEDESD